MRDYAIFSAKYVPKLNDIYMVKSGATTGNIAIVDTHKTFTIWSPLAVFRSNVQKMLPRFLYRILESNYFKKGVELSWSFGTQQNIGMGVLSNLSVICPLTNEQKAISKFLDDKCAQINEAIRIKERQIELLKEHRQITIHNAVTKGLDKNVPLKDSGVDWIGEIPKHWEIKRLKSFIQNLEGGVSVNASESESADGNSIGVLKTSCVYTNRFDARENKKVFSSDINRVACNVRKGAIIISRMNAPELVGASGLVMEEHPNLYLPDRLWQTIYNDEIEFSKAWLSHILICPGFRQHISMFINGSSPSMKNISKGDFLSMPIPVPAIDEQDEIASYINIAIQKTDQAISLKTQQITQLKTYKQSLINDVVTGKIRVPQLKEKEAEIEAMS